MNAFARSYGSNSRKGLAVLPNLCEMPITLIPIMRFA
jgi:hypothetical protein